MPKGDGFDKVLDELEKLTADVNENESSKKKKSKRSSKAKLDDKQIKEDLNKVKEIKKSLEILEKEVFIKINNPESIITNLVESKKIVKDITNSLMALMKLHKLREEIVTNLEKNIKELKDISHRIERELNLEEYSKTLGKEISNINENVISQYIDTIEEDIEEIKKYIGVAK